MKKSEDRLGALRTALREIKFPTRVRLPIDPSLEVNGILCEKCKFMDSKKTPLWLVFHNAHSRSTVLTMYKSGDDLRQDALTLQMLRLMSELWRDNALDLRMIPYGCVSTGQDSGFIEIVPDSDTICHLQKKSGGVLGAFKDSVVTEWLRAEMPPDMTWNEVVDNFVRSCAGYCVATWVAAVCVLFG